MCYAFARKYFAGVLPVLLDYAPRCSFRTYYYAFTHKFAIFVRERTDVGALLIK